MHCVLTDFGCILLYCCLSPYRYTQIPAGNNQIFGERKNNYADIVQKKKWPIVFTAKEIPKQN